MVSKIHASSDTMTRLVEDLLDFTEVDQARLRLDLRRADVSDLLAGLVETFRHQPGGHRLVAELPPSLEAEVDPERSEEHKSELQSRQYLVCRLLLE